MKTSSILLGIACLFIGVTANAQAKKSTTGLKTETIKVWGNCGMCKNTIEKAAKNAGASFALWNADTKMLQVKYAANKTNGTTIQQKIADAGYDTKDLTANDEAYKNLHECCQYERKANDKVEKEKQLASTGKASCCAKMGSDCAH